MRGQDLNLRPSGYEPDELPGCSTPRWCGVWGVLWVWEGLCRGVWCERVRRADLAATYSPTPWGAVPSALRVFTAEFGMGSGGSPLAVATRSARRTRAEPGCVAM